MKGIRKVMFGSRTINTVLGIGLVIAGVAAYRLGTTRAVTNEQTQYLTAATAGDAYTVSQTQERPAPDFTLKDVNGNDVKLSDYKGKVVVLNFWATWCPPCRKEIPDFIELQKTYEAQGLQFIGIALDDEGLPKVQAFLKTLPIPYPTLIADKNVVQKYGEMNAIPVTYLIDRKGVIRTRFVAMRPKQVVESMIAPLLAEK